MPRVLAIAAHPDDIEFLMAGTMMHLAETGLELHYWNLADGCCGSSELDADSIARVRLAEARAAADYLSATFHPPICRDLEIFYERGLLAQVAAVIRQVAPTIILTHSPSDYMEDHTNTARLVVTAAFARGMPNFKTEPPVEAVGDSVAIYHAQPYFHRDQLGRLIEPDIFVSVESVLERKVAALAKHISQKQWLDQSQGQDSYLETLRRLDVECGRMSKRFPFAEGWRRHWPIGFGPVDYDPLREILPRILWCG
jgi:LmbE family N-acetylglucosaminyl deacetylase